MIKGAEWGLGGLGVNFPKEVSTSWDLLGCKTPTCLTVLPWGRPTQGGCTQTWESLGKPEAHGPSQARERSLPCPTPLPWGTLTNKHRMGTEVKYAYLSKHSCELDQQVGLGLGSKPDSLWDVRLRTLHL